MLIADRDKDTVCAVSTPHGVGGISVIRISGAQAVEIISKVCPFILRKLESHRAYYGNLIDRNGQVIDEVVATYFTQGKSFTGEHTFEISCHGSPSICQSILSELVYFGARPADRGEFTYRAFMNGKLDLVQAESVLALIESQSQQATKMALRQLKGDLSIQLASIENHMTWILAHAEAGIDFSTEDIKVVDNSEVLSRLDTIEAELSTLVGTFNKGRIIKDGFRVVFTGVPNVGKSSLLNLFLQDDRAIVTHIAGTTRDVIDGDTSYQGVKFTFVDTAGLRTGASDLVEQIGIERSRAATDEADFVFFVYDVNAGLTSEELDILNALDSKRTFILANKSDQFLGIKESKTLENHLKDSNFFKSISDKEAFLKSRMFFVSALDKGIRSLVLDKLLQEFGDLQIENTVLISNARHMENLNKALENTQRARGVVQAGLGDEFLALEFKEALIAIQEILGKRFDDQIMDRVFKEFCIGK